MVRAISTKGIDLIKHFESFRPKAYVCPAGYWTIGFGTVINVNTEGYLLKKQIDPFEATNLLMTDLHEFEIWIKKLVRVRLNQNQFDALVSFVYNLGPYALKDSTLLKKINNDPEDIGIKDEFLKWTKAAAEKDKIDNDGDGIIDEKGEKKELAGLKARREAEAKLYFTPVK